MNYVKIKVSSENINLSLFIEEKQTYKKLTEIRELHNKYPGNSLSVTMKRVIIDTKKHRGIKDRLIGLDLVPSFTQLQIAA